MNRWLIVLALLLGTLTACADHRDPLPFYDTFDRPSTDRGLGDGWDLRGPYAGRFPLPDAKDGFLSDGKYTYAGNDVVYAVREFSSNVRQMGALGHWRKTGTGTETTLAMAISATDCLVTDMIHFTANRGIWDLTTRRNGGPFEPVASGKFIPALTLDRDYRFEIEMTETAVTVTVPGAEVVSSVDTKGLAGNIAFWEEYPSGVPAGTVFDFDAVWASDGNQQMDTNTVK